MFSPVVLSPPTWSNSAELGADDILKTFEHVLNSRKVSWIVGVPTSYQDTSKSRLQNKKMAELTTTKIGRFILHNRVKIAFD